jgi:tRNA U54 and U55 pseudouridine synthase Pus10
MDILDSLRNNRPLLIELKEKNRLIEIQIIDETIYFKKLKELKYSDKEIFNRTP